jgi:hypothetical protein
MITPLLEKSILSGKASYSKFTVAMGMFGRLAIPEDKLVIITDIKWNQFINPYTNGGGTTIDDFLNWNEYQMKIDAFKSSNIMTYRNNISIVKTNDLIQVSSGSTLTAVMGILHFIPGPPIIQDVFFICEGHIKITISRNAFRDTLTSNYGALSQKSTEVNYPGGIKNINVLKRLTMTSATPQTMYYTPPGDQYAGLATPGSRNFQNYSQDYDPLSQIYPPDQGVNSTINRPYLTQPLVEFGIVTINTNEYTRLANT